MSVKTTITNVWSCSFCDLEQTESIPATNDENLNESQRMPDDWGILGHPSGIGGISGHVCPYCMRKTNNPERNEP